MPELVQHSVHYHTINNKNRVPNDMMANIVLELDKGVTEKAVVAGTAWIEPMARAVVDEATGDLINDDVDGKTDACGMSKYPDATCPILMACETGINISTCFDVPTITVGSTVATCEFTIPTITTSSVTEECSFTIPTITVSSTAEECSFAIPTITVGSTAEECSFVIPTVTVTPGSTTLYLNENLYNLIPTPQTCGGFSGTASLSIPSYSLTVSSDSCVGYSLSVGEATYNVAIDCVPPDDDDDCHEDCYSPPSGNTGYPGCYSANDGTYTPCPN